MAEDFWLTKSIIPLLCKNPKLAGHSFCGPVSSSAKKTLEMLDAHLEELEYSLEITETVEGFSEYSDKLGELRGKIGTIRTAITKPFEYATTYEDGRALLAALRRIQSIDPRTNPEAAAKAYGAAMTSLGRLIEKLPPPANAVGTLIAEMGKIFHKIVANMQPEVHFKGDNKRIVDEDPTP